MLSVVLIPVFVAVGAVGVSVAVAVSDLSERSVRFETDVEV